MAINKVVYGNNALIDLTSDTAEASDVVQGKTFHLRSGEQATGTALGGTSIYDGDDSTGDLYSELFLGDVASGVDDVKVAFDMDLLWTNSSPSSSFSAQTVSLDLTNYKQVIIEYVVNTTSTAYCQFTVNINDKRTMCSVMWDNVYGRIVKCNANGVIFEDGKTGTGSSFGTSNSTFIPTQIYGIR